jgi:hypothetical protein
MTNKKSKRLENMDTLLHTEVENVHRTQHRLDNTGFLSSFGNQISVSKDRDLWFWGK